MTESTAATTVTDADVVDGGSDPIEVLETGLTRLMRRANLPRSQAWLLQRAQAPLDPAGYITLARVAELAPARLSSVADSLGVDSSTASRQVAALERNGLVERRRDPDDGRASLLAPTHDGAAALDRLRVARREALGDLVADWSSDDVRTFAGLVDRFTEALISVGDRT